MVFSKEEYNVGRIKHDVFVEYVSRVDLSCDANN